MSSKQGEHISRPLWATDTIREPEFANMSSGVPLQCQFCVGQSFRRSRLRVGDIPQILFMRYPVRCARCSQRQSVSFTVASISIPSSIGHRQRSGSSQREDTELPTTKLSGRPGNSRP
jgi:hypothetical protein